MRKSNLLLNHLPIKILYLNMLPKEQNLTFEVISSLIWNIY